LAAGLATTSACGIVGNPLADREAGPSASASASPSAAPSEAAEPVELAAGQCFDDNYIELLARTSVHLVDCAQQHFGETVYVGRFVGDAASGAAPTLSLEPNAQFAAAQNAAYLDCSARADAYLGHSWIHRLLTLQISVPIAPSWSAGERGYRCDLFQTSSQPDLLSAIVQRTGSLKTAWPGAVCIDENVKAGPIVDCKVKHPSEFVGGFLLPAGVKKAPTTKKGSEPYFAKCWKIMAPYLGVATSRPRYLVGVRLEYEYSESAWASGRRVVWCFTWTGNSSKSYVTGSAKGRKGKGL